MGLLRVTLNQVLHEFKNSLHSVDVRAAVSKSNSSWQSALLGIRLSTRPVEEVQSKHLDLARRFGKRQIEQFAILMQAFPFSELEGILRSINGGMIEIEKAQVVFPRSLSKGVNGMSCETDRPPLDELTGQTQRHQELLQHWEGKEWPGIFFATGEKSPLFSQPDIMRATRVKLGFSSAEELASTFLEFKEIFRHRLDFFIHVEMPAKILDVTVIGQTVKVAVTTENQLRNFHIFVKQEDPEGKLRQHQELRLELEKEGERFTLWKAKGDLESANKEDIISCTFTHENGFELDEERGRLWNFMPASEVNPLLECVKQFRDISALAQQLERPYETSKTKQGKSQQDIFQESIALLLSLAGFHSIDLGRDDKLRHPLTNVERATLDILAYHRNSNLMVLGACTITTPKNEDFDKLLHAKAILTRHFPSYSKIKFVPVLFSGQENEVAAHGEIKVLNPSKLATVRMMIENGEEERFLRFLSSSFLDQDI